MNLKSILQKSTLELKSTGISTPELDAKVLLEHSIDKDSVFLLTHTEYPRTKAEYHKFRGFIRRRKKGEPVAYIVRHKEFFGYDFFVNKNVLVPRPETEWLIEKGIEYIRDCHSERAKQSEESSEQSERAVSPRSFAATQRVPFGAQDDKFNIVDIGTGSGCIIISIALSLSTIYHLPSTINFYGVDIDKKAIVVAKKNAKKLEARNIKFFHSDLFSNQRLPEKFDLIIANLPYVPFPVPRKTNNRQPTIHNREGIEFEPQNAIFAKNNGSAVIKRFLEQAKSRIEKDGLVLLELDSRNAKEIFDFAKKLYPNSKIELKKDLARLERYLVIQQI